MSRSDGYHENFDSHRDGSCAISTTGTDVRAIHVHQDVELPYECENDISKGIAFSLSITPGPQGFGLKLADRMQTKTEEPGDLGNALLALAPQLLQPLIL